ncbi:restriction endonuclease subunit S [Glaesserella parasuis]|uniref:restriction endonuclease subunit S n=1 Tax=Glaesserella parasuis TaxID=738 RepID=UPI0024362F8B|nr:restriction endonuclease subunit S [Glaesserella parasuis]MDG6246169.1 restriction endonuclease subunit S [Glaesserella parasuis]
MIESRFIEKLLNGREVEWKHLGDIASYIRGLTYTKNNESPNNEGYKILRANNITLSNNTLNLDDIKIVKFDTKVKENQKLYKNDILISAASGSREHVGKVAFITADLDYYFGGFMGVIRCVNDVNPRYVFHILTSDLFQNYLNEVLNSSTINNLNSKVMEAFFVPIPPLDVQQEIVRILDAFTSLTAELTAELTSRQKQYQYFRDKLLNFDDISDRGGYETNPITKALWHNKKVVFKALGNISENLDFMRKPITSGLREKGNIPYYGASGIVDYVKDYIFEGDYLLVSEDGANLLARNTPIAFSISGKNWVNNHVHVLKFNTYTERRFVEFYLNNIDLTPYISGAAQPKLNKNNLSNIKIPAPPFEEQQRIVTILDKFETLTNSIAEGLPKEIELRRKQYEYYREKLLSFPQ